MGSPYQPMGISTEAEIFSYVLSPISLWQGAGGEGKYHRIYASVLNKKFSNGYLLATHLISQANLYQNTQKHKMSIIINPIKINFAFFQNLVYPKMILESLTQRKYKIPLVFPPIWSATYSHLSLWSK